MHHDCAKHIDICHYFPDDIVSDKIHRLQPLIWHLSNLFTKLLYHVSHDRYGRVFFSAKVTNMDAWKGGWGEGGQKEWTDKTCSQHNTSSESSI